MLVVAAVIVVLLHWFTAAANRLWRSSPIRDGDISVFWKRWPLTSIDLETA